MKTCWLCGNTINEATVEKLGTPIVELGLSNRARNALTRNYIDYVEQLIKLEKKRVLIFRNLGNVCFNEIKEKVNALGFDCWNS